MIQKLMHVILLIYAMISLCYDKPNEVVKFMVKVTGDYEQLNEYIAFQVGSETPTIVYLMARIIKISAKGTFTHSISDLSRQSFL